MTFALSTNWCNRRLASGEEIADLALELGFEALELGFHTTREQAEGFKRRLDRMPVGSVHAFAPVPISAPQGYPELYQLASFDAEARRMASLQVSRNLAFAAEMGADAVVLHAGRVTCNAWFAARRLRKRKKRGKKMTDILRRELDDLRPTCEKFRVALGLENLPYFEGFPNDAEMAALLANDFGEWVRPWFDTGHDYVARQNGWTTLPPPDAEHAHLLGMHVNDSNGGDDHLPPGTGKIDFAALGPLAAATRHIVLEPAEDTPAEALRTSLAYLRRIWTEKTTA